MAIVASRARGKRRLLQALLCAVPMLCAGCAAMMMLVGCGSGNEVEDAPSPPNALPTADFSASPTSGPAPLSVFFEDRSMLPGASITEWRWDFGDGVKSSERNPAHTFTAPGTYDVSLTVTSPSGTDMEAKAGFITVESETVRSRLRRFGRSSWSLSAATPGRGIQIGLQRSGELHGGNGAALSNPNPLIRVDG